MFIFTNKRELMSKIQHFSENEIDTCETCNKSDLTVKLVASHYVCDTCNKNRCKSCLKPVKDKLEDGYCSDCASFMLHSDQNDDLSDWFDLVLSKS